MLNLYELEQFIAFADLGTLNKVSEKFHISTPTITRSMQHIEESFGVPLFSRTKNKIELNETGYKAVACARNVLRESRLAIENVQSFDRALKTIVVKSCAPAPLWKLLPMVSTIFPNMEISSSIGQNQEVLSALNDKSCHIAILPFAVEEDGIYSYPFMKEHLSVFAKKGHQLSTYKQVSFSHINGFNFLLHSELGFWDTLCREKMPSSKFLVQENDFEYNELVKTSSLPCFVTEYSSHDLLTYTDRCCIPLTDDEAAVTFYIATTDRKLYESFSQTLSSSF